jgi:PAS domain S-box-containing protein
MSFHLLPTLAAVALAAASALAFAWAAQRRSLMRAHAALNAARQQAALSQALLENPSLALIAADATGVIQLFNPAAERLLGYKPGELVGRETTARLYAPDELANERDTLARELGEPISGPCETALLRAEGGESGIERTRMLVRRDGTLFPARVMLSPLRDSRGRADGFLLAARDITADRAAEQAAQARKNQLKEFFLHAPAAIALLDRDLRYLAVSQRWITDYGVADADLVGRAHLDIFSATPRHWRDTYRRCLSGAVEQGEDDIVVLADGSEQTIRWECHPWREHDGQIGGIAIFSEVLTEKRRAERRLVESEAKLRVAQELARVGSWELDLATNQLVVSEQFYRLHEITPGTPVSIDQALSFYTAGHRAAVAEAAGRALKEGIGWDLEVQIETSSGQRIWARSVGRPEMHHGAAVRIHGTIQDISERKAAEAAMTLAKDEALKAARTKADFLANMSHEIRTPLNAVIGMTGLLLSTSLDSEQREYVDTVRTASDNLLELINDILDFSKIESGKLELEQQPYSLHECIESALDLLAPRAAEKKLELASWLDESVPNVLVGDVTRVRQIIVNLLSNAVKFTAQGDVFISAHTRFSTDGPPLLRVTVRDTGIGIPADRLDRLFQSFSQVDSSTTRTHGGTGLGLAISRRLIELMGGRIWVESESGRGSRFNFEIPVQLAEADANERPRETFSLRHARILVIDDHATSREILELHLEAWDAIVECVASPLAALALIRQGEIFHAIVVDHFMPVMDGVEFTRQLRSSPVGVSIPVLLTTAVGRRGALSVDGLFAAVLAKPLKPRQLQHALNRILGSTIEPAQPAAQASSAPLMAGSRVLIVEDNPVNQRVARALLERMGLRPDLVAHGREAVEALDRQPYDIVLMDVHMPVMNGLDATREIRRRLSAEQQPVIIAMTASAMAKDRETCLNAGMDDFISKPVRGEDLQARLIQWQRTGRRPAPTVATSEPMPAS